MFNKYTEKLLEVVEDIKTNIFWDWLSRRPMISENPKGINPGCLNRENVQVGP